MSTVATAIEQPSQSSTKPKTSQAIVLYDGDCRLCQKSIAILKRIDWLHRLHFQNARDTENLPESKVPLIPERLLEEMHLVTPDHQKAYAGFRAFRWMSGRIPLLWTFYPMMFIPGVPTLGQKVYLWVAKNRFGLVPCKDGVCVIPTRKQ